MMKIMIRGTKQSSQQHQNLHHIITSSYHHNIKIITINNKMSKRLQNRIAESRFTLPVTTVIALLVWFAGGLIEKQLYVRLALLGISTYIMVEMNNRNALIRTYSRMVSCSFLLLTTMASAAFRATETFCVQLCMVAIYAILFSCYQDKRAQGKAFYAFFFLGVASLFFIQILFLAPFLWILMAVNLMAFNSRILIASLIGMTSPYWFLAGYAVFTGSTGELISHIMSIAEFEPLCQYEGIDTHLLTTLAFVTVISVTGTIHFLRNSYKDKIRTRMIYEMIITMNAIVFAFIILQPQHIEQLTSIMIITAGILIAHFIVLTHTRITNIAFYIIALSTIAITFYNIWISSLNFL